MSNDDYDFRFHIKIYGPAEKIMALRRGMGNLYADMKALYRNYKVILFAWCKTSSTRSRT